MFFVFLFFLRSVKQRTCFQQVSNGLIDCCGSTYGIITVPGLPSNERANITVLYMYLRVGEMGFVANSSV